MSTSELLRVENLHTEIAAKDGGVLHPVRGVSFSVRRGEIVGVVGETGSGKSLTVRSVMGLLPARARIAPGSAVWFTGTDLARLSGSELRRFWGEDVSLIPQDPSTSLNPVRTVGHQLSDVLRRGRGAKRLSKQEVRDKSIGLLTGVGISDPGERLKAYPHQLSGGMKQRVLIAMAMAHDPQLLIADEPTTALDVTIQRQILQLIRNQRDEHGSGVILVSHDLSVIAEFCDRVLVMYAGRVIEEIPAQHLHGEAVHPYTRGLMVSHPTITASPRTDLPIVKGEPPGIREIPSGCAFRPRCPRATEICAEQVPELTPRPGQSLDAAAACHHPMTPVEEVSHP